MKERINKYCLQHQKIVLAYRLSFLKMVYI
jgi:hypothetical protein